MIVGTRTMDFASIARNATDALGDPVRTCRTCRDGGSVTIADTIVVGEAGTFGACDRDGHERRAVSRAGERVHLVVLTCPDGTPLREAAQA